MRRLARCVPVGEVCNSTSANLKSRRAVCLLCQYHTRNRPTHPDRLTITRSFSNTPSTRANIGDKVMNWAADKIYKKPPQPERDDKASDRNTDNQRRELSDEEECEYEQGKKLDLDEEPVLTPEEREEQERQAEDTREYEIAQRQQEIDAYQELVDMAAESDAYTPAETWHGLEEVGGEKEEDFRDMEFFGFLPQTKLTTPEEITMAIYRAAVEVHAAHALDVPLTNIPLPAVNDLVNDTKLARLEPNQEKDQLGFGSLTFPSPDVEDAIMGYIRSANPETRASEVKLPGSASADEEIINHEAAVEEDQVKEGSESEEEISPPTPIPEPERYTVNTLRLDISTIDSASPSWRAIPLADPTLRLAIYRRALQLTGQTLPDITLSRCGTLGSLIQAAVDRAKPKPKGLYEELVATENLREDIANGDVASEEEIVKGPKVAGPKRGKGQQKKKRERAMVTALDLPNVRFNSRRVTPVDREREVGRWKVIEEELRRRNLPVLGKETAGGPGR